MYNTKFMIKQLQNVTLRSIITQLYHTIYSTTNAFLRQHKIQIFHVHNKEHQILLFKNQQLICIAFHQNR